MTKQEIAKICKKYKIINWTLNSRTNLIDVVGDVDLYGKNLTELPLPFGDVSNYFTCGNNNLTSLKHCPKNVGDTFSCGYNNLTSLEHCPRNVGGNFYCSYNKLTSLKSLFFDANGQSRNININGDLYCGGNPIPIYEYRWWFLGTMKNNVVGGQIHTSNVKLDDFLNEHKAPDAKELPNLFTKLRKFEE